ncbi:globoside alpha-1,3-N-acetylgalactosaminyltransferase 1 isoform X5 [Lagopus muta]|nr:globoside alpha-1,3-N-acetylgalactosaminyltransferase 1 isoform X5 [Lagopus muta]
MCLEHAVIKETVFVELKKRIRLSFFEHLEKWFAESLSNSWATVDAKKEELGSELQQHLLSCELRRENIETNISSVRAAELLLHEKHLECHCDEVEEALKKERAEFLRFCNQQNDNIQNLDSRIRDMESAFLRSPVAERLASSSSSVCPDLLHYLDVIRVSLRSYRNYLEENLGKLRDSNVDFLKGCRLFVEGGNFSPEEVQSFSKRLQKESKRIDSFERLIVADMEKMESRCLEQATEIINQAETRLRCLSMNRVFMEKIQRLLTNLRVQIKSEVANSNLQAAALKSCLEKLHAFAHPAADKEALTSEELYDFIKAALKELKARSQYLDCLLVDTTGPRDNERFAPPAAEVTLQGPIAAAIRVEHRLVMMGLDPGRFPLLNPSRMGKSAIDDLSVSVIKNLLEVQSSRRKSSGRHQDSRGSLEPATLTTQRKNSHLNVSDEGPRSSAAHKHAARSIQKPATKKRASRGSMQKCTKSVLSDKRFQIFGEMPPESSTFKGTVMKILWMGNNNLLCLAEEFYHKEKHQTTMPEDLPETFERFAEVIKQTLLSYQSQIDDYYNSCLKEFWDQLKSFEEELPYVSQLAVDGLLKEHEQKLSYATSNIEHSFNQQLEDWRSVKAERENELRPSLGHPDNLLQLEALCQRESKEQKDHVDAVHLHTRMLQDCAAECTQNFVLALAAFTEKLLLELDESITIDDIQAPKTETPKQKTSLLIPHKQAGLPLQTRGAEQLVERGRRVAVGNWKVHYLPYYLPCPGIFSKELLYLEEKPVQLFPQLFYQQPRVLAPKRQDVLTVTPWLAPIVWEGTFSPEILDSVYMPLNLTIGVTAFAIGKYTRFVGRFLESAEMHFMKGYRVNYYIFTDNPEMIPSVQLQPGRRFDVVHVKKYPSWQEISMRRMETINLHIAERSHQEVDYLFCLDIDMVFHNAWGAETLGDIVAAIHPGYFNVPRSQFPYERRSSSAAYIPEGEGDFYYGGAVFGGLVKKVYEFTRTCHMTILADKANGIMAAWQEESHLNRHFLSHKPSKVLSPEYIWDDRKPKPPEIYLIRFSTVDKNYQEVRN